MPHYLTEDTAWHPTNEAANVQLRDDLSCMLSDGGKLRWFATPNENLSQMLEYACVRGGEVIDYHLVMRS